MALKHASIDGFRLLRRLPGRNVDHVDAGIGQHARNFDRVRRRYAVRNPIVGGNAHRNRLVVRPHRPHRAKHLERKPHAVLETSAILVGASVGERRNEGRHQITVRIVQFEPVKTGALRHLRRTDELVAHFIHVGARHRSGRLVLRAPRNRRWRHHRPVAGGQRRIHRFPPELG